MTLPRATLCLLLAACAGCAGTDGAASGRGDAGPQDALPAVHLPPVGADAVDAGTADGGALLRDARADAADALPPEGPPDAADGASDAAQPPDGGGAPPPDAGPEDRPACAGPCDDGDPCTDDRCDPVLGCVAAPACADGDCCTADRCDPVTGACLFEPVGCPDADGDGSPGCADCDDGDPFVFPGGPEVLGDGHDGDCDGAELVPSDEVGVFVAPGGDDEGPGTMGAPLRTLRAAMDRAEARGAAVFAAEGTWDEALTVRAPLYGGLDPSDWRRPPQGPGTRLRSTSGTASAVVPSDGVPPGRSRVVQGVDLAAVIWPALRVEAGAEGQVFVLADSRVAGEVELTFTRSGRVRLSGCAVDASGEEAPSATALRVEAERFARPLVSVVRTSLRGGGEERTSGLHVVGDASTELDGSFVHGGFGLYATALRLTGGTLTAWNSVLVGGADGYRSAAVDADPRATVTFVHSVLHGGTARGDTLVLEQCTGALVVNSVLLGGAGLRATLIGDCPGVRLHGNVLWAPDEPLAPGVWDAAALDACGWEGCGAASGNRSADPRLADPLAGDGHLLPGSPCVDAGVQPGTVVFPWPVTDVDGQPRPQGGGYDVGVDERAAP